MKSFNLRMRMIRIEMTEERESMGQLAKPGLPGKWPVKMVCVCVWTQYLTSK